MRKLVFVLALVFTVAFGFGAATPDPAEAVGPCYFTCSCSGQPLYCCENADGVSCKPALGWECPQVYNC